MFVYPHKGSLRFFLYFIIHEKTHCNLLRVVVQPIKSYHPCAPLFNYFFWCRYTGREICFCYNEDDFTIADVTDKFDPDMVARITYNGAQYTHQVLLKEIRLPKA